MREGFTSDYALGVFLMSIWYWWVFVEAATCSQMATQDVVIGTLLAPGMVLLVGWLLGMFVKEENV